MTWTRKTISVSADMPPLSCSVIPVTPWTYGLGRYEESGVYLSPPNAINWLAGKMAGSRASGDVTIIMIAENTHDLCYTVNGGTDRRSARAGIHAGTAHGTGCRQSEH